MRKLFIIVALLICSVPAAAQVSSQRVVNRLTDPAPGTCLPHLVYHNTVTGGFWRGSASSVCVPTGTGSGTVTSVTGTANQITVTGTTTPVLSLSSTLIAPGTLTATTSTASPFFISTAADPADAGAVRLGTTECLGWEANTPGTDLTLCKNASDIFAFSAPHSGPTLGVTDASNAAAGQVGEVIPSEVLIGSPVALTSATAANVTSISLTAGDWEVYGNVCLVNVDAPTATGLYVWTSDVSATFPTRPNKGGMQGLLFAANITNGVCLSTGTRRYNVSSTTPVYLSVFEIFSGGTSSSAYGYIEGRRLR